MCRERARPTWLAEHLEQTVGVLYRREISEAKDEEAARRARILELEDKFANPYVAAERGFEIHVLFVPGDYAAGIKFCDLSAVFSDGFGIRARKSDFDAMKHLK